MLAYEISAEIASAVGFILLKLLERFIGNNFQVAADFVALLIKTQLN